jgi:V-type H+-transporting ATPase subunit a
MKCICVIRFECPKDSEQALNDIIDRKGQSLQLLNDISENIKSTLASKFDEKYSLNLLQKFVNKEKLIYQAINTFSLSKCGLTFTGKCWSPVSSITPFPQTIKEIADKVNKLNAGISISIREKQFKKKMPPTCFRSNQFIDQFQSIIDIYGTPSYKEVNPFIIFSISFPFFFGLMFGDVCHGLVLLFLAIYLCISGDYLSKNQSLPGFLYKARYILLLMGLFSVLCGLILNEIGAMPVFWMKSCYSYSKGLEHYSRQGECNYGAGIDGIWYE